jgi:hypothetical protein
LKILHKSHTDDLSNVKIYYVLCSESGELGNPQVLFDGKADEDI